MATKKQPETKPEETAAVDWDELVEIQLFKDNDNYKDDVFVGVNGRHFLIQRGVMVKVPRYVAEVIRQSEEADRRTGMMMRELSEKYERATEEKTRPE